MKKYLRYSINFILSFFVDVEYFFTRSIRARVHGVAYYRESKLFPGYLKQGDMERAVRTFAGGYCQGKGLDIGAGKWPFPGARAVEDHGEENAYRLKETNETQDFIFSSHTLEHLEKWQEALCEWHRVLRSGGTIFLYLPHEACRMWDVGVNVQHLWTPTTDTVAGFLERELGMEVVYKTYLPDGFLSFCLVAQKK